MSEIKMEIKKKTFDEKTYKIINGDSLQVLDTLEENSIDAIITDPPYGLTSITKRFGKENSAPAQYGKDGSFARLSKGFMGKEWDGSGIEYNVELWKKALRVLKSGGYLLAFGGSRTFHRIACAIEDAGFEIRDTIMWLYGSGFPKSLNIGKALDKKNGVDNVQHKGKWNFDHGNMEEFWKRKKEYKKEEEKPLETELAKQWSGWGTALKPAFEPIIVARKPCEGSCIENIIKYGVGGINIDECRVGNEVITQLQKDMTKYHGNKLGAGHHTQMTGITTQTVGRFPANVILTYDENDYNEVCGNMPESNGGQGKPFKANEYEEHNTATNFTRGDFVPYNDNGSASRYFYCAKASKKDRDSGLDFLESMSVNDGRKTPIDNAFQRGETLRKNIHPTVKPVELMQYLVRLVSPKGATILDIFNGSGSTGKAVAFENRERDANYKYIGIELDKQYCEISKSRIDYALNKFEYDMIQDIKQEEERTGQMSLFDIDYE